MRGKLLRLRQLKEFVGMLDKVRESCQGILGVETLDFLKGKRTICRVSRGNLFILTNKRHNRHYRRL
jgi:hypothetical protein